MLCIIYIILLPNRYILNNLREKDIISKMTSENTLWMGDLEEYMDHNFVVNAFHQMGESVVNAKLIINKQTSTGPYGKPPPYAYCFVEFSDPETAQRVLLRLNGKIMPGSSPPKRFKLNNACFGKGNQMMSEYSLFVGDLSEDIDDYTLYQAFSKRYKSCKAAKVVLDNEGKKKGYGFVRFTDEADQVRALHEMNHFTGIGTKTIRVSLAAPKRPPYNPNGPPYSQPYGPYSNYYQGYQQQQYHHNYWGQGYNQNYYQNYYQGYPQDTTQTQSDNTNETTTADTKATYDSDSEALEDPCEELDIAKLNKEYMEQSEELYIAMDASRWTALDSVTSKLECEAS